MRHRTLTLLLGLLLVVMNSSVATGSHDGDGVPHPTIGGSRGNLVASQVINWNFAAGGYPGWVRTRAFEPALEVNLSDPTKNYSRTPTFNVNSPTAGATALMWYSAATDSPCNPVFSPSWIQCARNWTTTSLEIFIRNFDAAPLGGLGWYEENNSCTGYTACHMARRALMHEASHALYSLDHDGQGNSLTVMGALNPCTGSSNDCNPPNDVNWNWLYLLECDEAAAQLLWDLPLPSGQYANCFQNITGHGTAGNMKTNVFVTGSAFTQCSAVGPESVSGRLQVYDDPNLSGSADPYYTLAANPLGGRVVRFNRRLGSTGAFTLNVHSTTANINNPGDNWTASIPYPGQHGIWYYQAHFDGDVGLHITGLAQFTINWVTSPCPQAPAP